MTKILFDPTDIGPFIASQMKVMVKSLYSSIPQDAKISLGDAALLIGADTACSCAQIFPESERRNLIRMVFPSVKRACVRIDDEAIRQCVALVDRYLEGEEISNEDFIAANDIISILNKKQTADHFVHTLIAFQNVLQGIVNRKEHTVMILMTAPAEIRFFAIRTPSRQKEEEERFIKDICNVYPPLLKVSA